MLIAIYFMVETIKTISHILEIKNSEKHLI